MAKANDELNKTTKVRPKGSKPTEESKAETPVKDDKPLEEPKAETPVKDDKPLEEPKAETSVKDDKPAEEPKAETLVKDDEPVEEPKAETSVKDDKPAEEPKAETLVKDDEPVEESAKSIWVDEGTVFNKLKIKNNGPETTEPTTGQVLQAFSVTDISYIDEDQKQKLIEKFKRLNFLHGRPRFEVCDDV